MTDSENLLSIIFEEKNKKVPMKSTIKEIEKEFKQKFELTDSDLFYLYFKLDDDNIILNEGSFQEFNESNTKELFAKRKIKEDNLQNKSNIRNINSEFEIFVKELEEEINKIKKRKENKISMIIRSKECEVEYNKNEELRMQIDNLIKENQKLKEIEKKYNENKQKKEQSNQIKIKEQNDKDAKNLRDENIKLKSENDKLLEENKKLLKENENLKNDIQKKEEEIKKLENKNTDSENVNKNLNLIINENTNEYKIMKKKIRELKMELITLRNKLNNNNINNSSKIIPLNIDKFEINISQKTISTSSSEIEQSKVKKNNKNKKIKIINKINKENKIKFSKSEIISKEDFQKIKDIEEKNKKRLKMKLSNSVSYLDYLSKSQSFN